MPKEINEKYECSFDQRMIRNGKATDKPFLFNEIDPLNQKIAVTLYHDKHIQHILFLDDMLNLLNKKKIKNSMYSKQKNNYKHRRRWIKPPSKLQTRSMISYAKESTFVVTKLEELKDVRAGLGALDLALFPKDG